MNNKHIKKPAKDLKTLTKHFKFSRDWQNYRVKQEYYTDIFKETTLQVIFSVKAFKLTK